MKAVLRAYSMGKNKEKKIIQLTKFGDYAAIAKILNKPKYQQNGSRRLNLDFADDDGLCALHHAARFGHVQLIQLLLERGAHSEVGDRRGYRAIHHAVVNGHAQAVVALLRFNADVNASATDGVTALHVAAHTGRTDIVRLLSESHGASVSATNNQMKTALDVACEQGNYEVVQYLLSFPAVQKQLTGTRTGIGASDLQLFKLLVARKFTPLHYAARGGHVDVLTLLIKQPGVNINSATPRGTALHEAAGAGHYHVVKFLCEQGADVSIRNDFGLSALDVAHKIVTQVTSQEKAHQIKCIIQFLTNEDFVKMVDRQNVVRRVKKEGQTVRRTGGSQRTQMHRASVIGGSQQVLSHDAYFNTNCLPFQNIPGSCMSLMVLPSYSNGPSPCCVAALSKANIGCTLGMQPQCVTVADRSQSIDYIPNASQVCNCQLFPCPVIPNVATAPTQAANKNSKRSKVKDVRAYSQLDCSSLAGSEASDIRQQLNSSGVSTLPKNAPNMNTRYASSITDLRVETRNASQPHSAPIGAAAVPSVRNVPLERPIAAAKQPTDSVVQSNGLNPSAGASLTAVNTQVSSNSAASDNSTSSGFSSGTASTSTVQSQTPLIQDESEYECVNINTLTKTRQDEAIGGNPNFLDVRSLLQRGTPDNDALYMWLCEHNLQQHFEKLVDAGFDWSTLTTITFEDLKRLGITDEKDIRLLHDLMRKVDLAGFDPLSRIYDDIVWPQKDAAGGLPLSTWLGRLGVQYEDYNTLLLQQGYCTVQQMMKDDFMTEEDLRAFGIEKAGHARKVNLALLSLRKKLMPKKRSNAGLLTFSAITGEISRSQGLMFPVAKDPYRQERGPMKTFGRKDEVSEANTLFGNIAAQSVIPVNRYDRDVNIDNQEANSVSVNLRRASNQQADSTLGRSLLAHPVAIARPIRADFYNRSNISTLNGIGSYMRAARQSSDNRGVERQAQLDAASMTLPNRRFSHGKLGVNGNPKQILDDLVLTNKTTGATRLENYRIPPPPPLKPIIKRKEPPTTVNTVINDQSVSHGTSNDVSFRPTATQAIADCSSAVDVSDNVSDYEMPDLYEKQAAGGCFIKAPSPIQEVADTTRQRIGISDTNYLSLSDTLTRKVYPTQQITNGASKPPLPPSAAVVAEGCAVDAAQLRYPINKAYNFNYNSKMQYDSGVDLEAASLNDILAKNARSISDAETRRFSSPVRREDMREDAVARTNDEPTVADFEDLDKVLSGIAQDLRVILRNGKSKTPKRIHFE